MGYLQIYTGDGKGKTTAAAGIAVRALGRDKRVFFGQFLKHTPSGETIVMSRLPGCTLELFGAPRKVGDPASEEDRTRAALGLKRAHEAVVRGEYELVVLDEINVAASMKLLSVEDVLALVRARCDSCELVLTGRNADTRLIDMADLVTEMRNVRHYLDEGVSAREGIEF